MKLSKSIPKSETHSNHTKPSFKTVWYLSEVWGSIAQFLSSQFQVQHYFLPSRFYTKGGVSCKLQAKVLILEKRIFQVGMKWGMFESIFTVFVCVFCLNPWRIVDGLWSTNYMFSLFCLPELLNESKSKVLTCF